MTPDKSVEGAILAPGGEALQQFLIRDLGGIELFRQMAKGG